MRNGTGGPSDRTWPGEKCSPTTADPAATTTLNALGASTGAGNVGRAPPSIASSRRAAVAFESERQQGARPTWAALASVDRALAQQACTAADSQHARTTGSAL